MKQTIRFRAFILTFLLVWACGEGTDQKVDESTPQRENPRNLSDDLITTDQIIWDSTFTDLEGNTVRLSDFEGKVVLIDFWETWCGPCLEVFPAMDSLRKEYGDDFEVLAVNLQNSDEAEDVREFAERKGYDFHWLLDTDKVGDQVITYGIPFKVFADTLGYLINAEVGTLGQEGDYKKAKEIIEMYRSKVSSDSTVAEETAPIE